MKHIFHICPNIAESYGLEKILNFYNVVVCENNDNIEDFINAGNNIIYIDNFNSKELEEFVNKYSYNEKPFILSSVLPATIKLSQLYDWDIKGVRSNETILPSNTEKIIFNVYKKMNSKIFGNIHKYFSIDYDKFTIEVMDWSFDYISEVKRITSDLNSLENGFNTIECSINSDNKLNVINSFPDSLPSGMSIYTRAQIMNSESPLILNEIFDDIEKEDPLSFVEGFDPKDPISQIKPFEITTINIKTKYETIIKNNFTNGIWKYGGDNTGKTEKICMLIYEIDEDGDKTLCLLHKGFSLYDVEYKEGIVINTNEKNKSLKSGDIFATLRIPYSSIDSQSNLYGWVYEIINSIIHIQTQ